MAKVAHPSIIEYKDSFASDDCLHIVMEFASGGDLANFIRKQGATPLPEEDIWRLLIQVTAGLRHLHAARILHRDIKAENIFIDGVGRVKIGDLGLGRMLDGKTIHARTTVGTPLYFSPELCDERPYNEKSDIWALGCLVYELCTFKPPFVATNQLALARKILREQPPPLPTTYTMELAFLIAKMLEKDPNARPSAAQILEYSPVRQRLCAVESIIDADIAAFLRPLEPAKCAPSGNVPSRNECSETASLRSEPLMKEPHPSPATTNETTVPTPKPPWFAGIGGVLGSWFGSSQAAAINDSSEDVKLRESIQRAKEEQGWRVMEAAEEALLATFDKEDIEPQAIGEPQVIAEPTAIAVVTQAGMVEDDSDHGNGRMDLSSLVAYDSEPREAKTPPHLAHPTSPRTGGPGDRTACRVRTPILSPVPPPDFSMDMKASACNTFTGVPTSPGVAVRNTFAIDIDANVDSHPNVGHTSVESAFADAIGAEDSVTTQARPRRTRERRVDDLRREVEKLREALEQELESSSVLRRQCASYRSKIANQSKQFEAIRREQKVEITRAEQEATTARAEVESLQRQLRLQNDAPSDVIHHRNELSGRLEIAERLIRDVEGRSNELIIASDRAKELANVADNLAEHLPLPPLPSDFVCTPRLDEIENAALSKLEATVVRGSNSPKFAPVQVGHIDEGFEPASRSVNTSFHLPPSLPGAGSPSETPSLTPTSRESHAPCPAHDLNHQMMRGLRASSPASVPNSSAQLESSMDSAGGDNLALRNSTKNSGKQRYFASHKEYPALRRSSQRDELFRRSWGTDTRSAPATPSVAIGTVRRVEGSGESTTTDTLPQLHSSALQLPLESESYTSSIPESFGVLHAWRRQNMPLPTQFQDSADYLTSVPWLHSGAHWPNRQRAVCTRGCDAICFLIRRQQLPEHSLGTTTAPRAVRVRYRHDDQFRPLRLPTSLTLPSKDERLHSEWILLDLPSCVTRHREIVEFTLDFEAPHLIDEVIAIVHSPALVRTAIIHARACARSAAAEAAAHLMHSPGQINSLPSPLPTVGLFGAGSFAHLTGHIASNSPGLPADSQNVSLRNQGAKVRHANSTARLFQPIQVSAGKLAKSHGPGNVSVISKHASESPQDGLGPLVGLHRDSEEANHSHDSGVSMPTVRVRLTPDSPAAAAARKKIPSTASQVTSHVLGSKPSIGNSDTECAQGQTCENQQSKILSSVHELEAPLTQLPSRRFKDRMQREAARMDSRSMCEDNLHEEDDAETFALELRRLRAEVKAFESNSRLRSSFDVEIQVNS